ncbi:molybdopterin-synthase adenylyltransferase MoeB [Emticicia sp. 21SJ11W-3]|uniref:molybdopterin-synthase adenylyltransferase MoeB n=1 Tax=Emticicia sp. 21SJ11W-3 TaxID=2916755 RepID=UPI00209CDB5B|nr:molybdopterin-synthase adenylyltransferase MoeB [Emticicia sp. 21SJ11W-3]UTA69275.1 molybdopterin-synthase adenylyltransferase MoeB [Emticicia sp. 21SJ11W-3]
MALTSEEIRRYDRQIILPELGLSGQQKLKEARVLVVGCGGLGCPVLLYLAAAGTGTIGIVEDDTVALSNLQRQIMYTTDTVGEPKLQEATKRLKMLNPLVNFIGYHTRLMAENALEIISNYDIVVDGTDNFQTRYLVNDACVMLNKPYVYGAINRFEGHVALFNYNESATYRDLFPSPPPPEQAPNCAEAGVLGVLPGIIGSIQALEAIKAITGIGEPLAGKLLIMDTLSMQSRMVRIPKIPGTPAINKLIDYEAFCGVPADTSEPLDEISYEAYMRLTESCADEPLFQLIDVREKHEYDRFNINGELMPLSELEKHLDKIRLDQTVVIHCQSGIRSRKAISLLKEKYGFNNLINLSGGINAIVAPGS